MPKQTTNKASGPSTPAVPGRKRVRGNQDENPKPAKRARKRRKAAPKKAAPHSAEPLNKLSTQRLDVYVFGTGLNGELGLGAKSREGLKDPALVARPHLNDLLSGKQAVGGGVVQISVGDIHCAAVTANGKVITWGANDTNPLGRDTEWTLPENGGEEDNSDYDGEPELNPLESTPAVIPAANFKDGGANIRFVRVQAIDNATFAVAEDGRVWGWGMFMNNEGPFGFLKDKIKVESKPTQDDMIESRPVLIPGLKNVKELAGGTNHMLALTHDGNVYAWGCGTQHELGRRFRRLRASSKYDSLVPSHVALPKNKTVKIFAGSHQSFAIDTSGKVYAWGLNNYCQTGIPPTRAEREGLSTITVMKPTVVRSLEKYKIIHLGSGSHHSIACTEEGDVLVWGRCDDGQAGQPLDSIPQQDMVLDSRGRPRELSVPTVVPGVTATSVAAGIDCCMAVSPGGQVFSWGYSDSHRTGQGIENTVEAPQPLKEDAAGKTLSWAHYGGQFGVVAGPAGGG